MVSGWKNESERHGLARNGVRTKQNQLSVVSNNPRTIQYAVDENGLFWSRVGSEVAFPVLDYESMTPENNYNETYHLEKGSIYTTIGQYLVWTKNLPISAKNEHRKFWGMPLLKKKNNNQ
jgi:hypothetical protein